MYLCVCIRVCICVCVRICIVCVQCVCVYVYTCANTYIGAHVWLSPGMRPGITMATSYHLVGMVMHTHTRNNCTLTSIPISCELQTVVKSAPVEVQGHAAMAFATILHSDAIQPHTFTSTFLPTLLTQLRSKTPGTWVGGVVLLHGWVGFYCTYGCIPDEEFCGTVVPSLYIHTVVTHYTLTRLLSGTVKNWSMNMTELCLAHTFPLLLSLPSLPLPSPSLPRCQQCLAGDWPTSSGEAAERCGEEGVPVPRW